MANEKKKAESELQDNQAQNATEANELQTLKEAIAKKDAYIEQLETELMKYRDAGIDAPVTFSRENLIYEFKAKQFHFEGKVWTPQEIKEDDAALDRLLAVLWAEKTEVNFNNSILRIVY